MIWLILLGVVIFIVVSSNIKTNGGPHSPIGAKPKINTITCELVSALDYQKLRENKEPIQFEIELPRTLYKKDWKIISSLKVGDPIVISWWEEESETSRSWGISVDTIEGKGLGRPPYADKFSLANRFDFIKRARIEEIDYDSPRIWVIVEFS